MFKIMGDSITHLPLHSDSVSTETYETGNTVVRARVLAYNLLLPSFSRTVIPVQA